MLTPPSANVNQMCLSAMESATSGTFDVCYPTRYIEKMAFVQKMLKRIVDNTISVGMVTPLLVK